jgi:hypothetical protein
MIYAAVRNEVGAIEHVPCPDLHFTPDVEAALNSVGIRAVAARSAPSTPVAPTASPSQKMHVAPAVAAPTSLPQWLLDAAADIPAHGSLPPSRQAIAESWERSLRRVGARLRDDPPAVPGSWEASVRRHGLALVGDPVEPPTAAAPAAPVSASASWDKSFARIGAKSE